MSQKASRKGAVNEEKEKLHTDTPVKDIKKKMAVSAEKEKQPTEKKDAEKPIEKSTDKSDKPAEKADKPEKKLDKSLEKKTDKPAEKKVEKPAEKKVEKPAEKKSEKTAEKKDAPVEKKEDSTKDDKGGKSEKAEQKRSDKSKLNGNSSFNGTTNGTDENGTVSAADDDDDDVMVIDETDQDDMFPELTYDDTSDPEFEPDTATSRSFTRRSQAKVTRTPETPRPASDKQGDNATNDDSKILKLKDDAYSTDRKLRSADSPKPQESKKPQESDKKPQESDKKPQESKEGKTDSETKEQEEKENGDKSEKVEVEVVVDVEGGDDEPRKTDTNYSKSRVKVSPYRRSGRLADQTTSSMMANYTGNNTTMEMDITESPSFLSEDPSLDDSSYLSGLRSIRGRKSYKPLKEMTLRHIASKSAARSVNVSAIEQPSRPTAPVVGRKRKPEGEEPIELASEASEPFPLAHGKRARLLDRLASSFRRTASSTPLPARRAAEIVGINTDLPLSVPLAAPALDPEALKADVAVPLAPAAGATNGAEGERDKKCILM